MKHVIACIVLLGAALGPSGVLAKDLTIKLSVPGMKCAACPYIVQEAIASVSGVKAVSATIVDKTATVTYDDAATGPDAILNATAGIGYEASIVGGAS